MKTFTFLVIVVWLLYGYKVSSQSFTEQSISLPGISNGSALWGDYDNDNDLDILIIGDQFSTGTFITVSKLYRNNGNNVFSEQTGISLLSGDISSAAWGDYNNDGYLDIYISSQNPGSRIYRNNGNNSFTEQSGISLPGVRYGSAAWGDFNNDGHLDILFTGQSVTNSSISKIYHNNGNNTFSELSSILLKSVIQGSSSCGDYDNDGFLDVLITGEAGGANSILYHNNGDNTFSENKIGMPGVSSGSAAWGDYDNDGNLDILLAGQSTNGIPVSKIYRNNGDDTFTEQTGIALTGVQSGSVAWGDYNNDTYLDILLTGLSGSGKIAKVYRNNGNNTFTELTGNSFSGVSYSNGAWGDYDNDGQLDILLSGTDANEKEITKIYKNNSLSINNGPDQPDNLSFENKKNLVVLKWNRVYSSETTLKSITYNVRIGSTNLNTHFVPSHSAQNGIRRIVAMGNAILDTIFIFKYCWDTTYYASVQAVDNSFKGGLFSDAIQFKIDPIQASKLTGNLVNSSSILLKWNRGNGDRCIVFAKEGPSGPVILQNYTTYYSNSVYGESPMLGTTGWYTVYKGEADSVLISGLSPQKSYTFQVVEFQGINGREIYASQNTTDNIALFSSGLFTKQTGITLPGVEEGSAAWGDYNNDSFLDILLTGNSTSNLISKIFKNNGDNTFTEQTGITLTGTVKGSTAWGDYDNDGYLDIILTGETEYYPGFNPICKIYHNNGNNTFTEQTAISLANVYLSSAAWGDYDNDGNLDFLITGSTGSGYISKIYRNNGDKTFTEQSGISLTGVYISSVAWGDYNNDGNLDILLTGTGQSGPMSTIYENKGNNTFTERKDISLMKVSGGSACWGDYDNDGDLDILITGYSNSGPVSRIYRNDKGAFTDINVGLSGVSSGSLAWGDYDNDGFLDILMTGINSYSISKIYHNNNGNNFTEKTNSSLDEIVLSSVAWGDYDNDGDLDILMVGRDNTNNRASKIYSNNLIMNAGSFKPNFKPTAPTGMASTITPTSIKFTWTPVNNDESPTRSMSYNIRYKLRDATNWKLSPHAADNGFRRVPAYGNIQLSKYYYLKNLAPGTYVWQVQAVDQGFMGGNWSEQQSFTVPNIIADFKADTVCKGTETKFTDLSLGLGEPITSWKWDFDDGNTSETQNPGHIFAAAKSYQVKLIIRSTSYSDTIIKTVEVKPGPIASFDIEKKGALVCQFINNTNEQKVSSWLWNFGDGSTSDLQDPPLYAYSADGIYQVSLKVSTENGCIDSVTNENIVCSTGLEQPEMYVRGPNVWYFAASNDSVSNYRWSRNDQLISNANGYIYVANKLLGTYYVEINNGGACWIPSEKVTIPDDFYNGHAKKIAKNPELQSNESSILVFPNPNKGKFTLLFDNEFKGKLKINIKDLSGKTLRQYYADKTESFYIEEMDLSKYGKGVYFIEMNYQDKKESVKMVIE